MIFIRSLLRSTSLREAGMIAPARQWIFGIRIGNYGNRVRGGATTRLADVWPERIEYCKHDFPGQQYVAHHDRQTETEVDLHHERRCFGQGRGGEWRGLFSRLGRKYLGGECKQRAPCLGTPAFRLRPVCRHNLSHEPGCRRWHRLHRNPVQHLRAYRMAAGH